MRTLTELSEEQKEALRALYDHAEARMAEHDGECSAEFYCRSGIAAGILRAAQALGFDLWGDWKRRQRQQDG
jgi:hypothetical protein